MSDAQNYDAKNLDTLRRDLKDLRTQAREDGVLKSPGPGKPDAAGGGMARRLAGVRDSEPTEKGKQVASRLLATLERGEEDDSPTVRGTNFTENGVKQLLEQLASPPKNLRAAAPLLQRMHKFLTTPPQNGAQMVAGANPDRIKLLANLLPQVEQHGWELVRSRLNERKDRLGGQARPNGPVATAPPPAAPAKRKRPTKRT